VRLYYESPEGGISVGEMIDGDDASLMCEYHESKEWINHKNHGIIKPSMTTKLIKTILPPNSMGILGNIPKGKHTLPSESLNSFIDGIRVLELSCFLDDEDIMHEDSPSSIIHR
jgi:hypothetical protein